MIFLKGEGRDYLYGKYIPLYPGGPAPAPQLQEGDPPALHVCQRVKSGKNECVYMPKGPHELPCKMDQVDDNCDK